MHRHLGKRINTALVPIGTGDIGDTALNLAQALADEVILVGVVPVGEEETMSAGAQAARQVRKRLFSFSSPSIRFKSTVIVSETPWKDLNSVIDQEKPDLVFIEWKEGQLVCGFPILEVLSNPLCDVAIVRGSSPFRLDRTLITVRGGPHAELAFQIGMGMQPKQIDVLHLALKGVVDDAPFKGLKEILRQIPEVNLRSVITQDVARSILDESRKYDLVILGVTASRNMGVSSIGAVAEKLLRESPSTIMVVKTRRPIAESMFNETIGVKAISILVDKWFAENTFHADEFLDLKRLMEFKEKQGSSISLAMPSLNEEKTVHKVITTIKKALMDNVPLLDEMVLIDSDSTDRTRKIAEELGIPVYIHQQVLPELGARPGKGEALWKSLLVTKGDIIAWIDTDIVNIHPRFVYGIVGPLLLNRDIQFVKGFYRRPLKTGGMLQAGGGGRVTELTARPLLNLFYPELSGVIQPLSGEYAGRREALENAIFFSGYGVETGLLIDIFEKYGLRSIAQVDLLERIHHNQELEALGKMSFAIIQTVLHKLEERYERSIIEDINKSIKLIRRTKNGYYLDVEEVAEHHRPLMISVPAYRERHKR